MTRDTVADTDNGINPIHASGIFALNATDNSVIVNTTKKMPANAGQKLYPKSDIVLVKVFNKIYNIHTPLLVIVPHNIAVTP
jgi:hypothetical protein